MRTILAFHTIFFCMITTGMAQNKAYLEGYVILNGDTTYGWVKDRSPEPFTELYAQIRFKAKKKERRKKYSPREIDGYGRGGQHYESVPVKEETSFFIFRYYLNKRYDPVFLKVIDKNDYLIYYEKEFVHDDNSYLDSYPLFYIRGRSEMVRVTQGILGLKKKRLIEYFEDCPSLISAIEEDQLKTTRDVFDFFLLNCIE